MFGFFRHAFPRGFHHHFHGHHPCHDDNGDGERYWAIGGFGRHRGFGGFGPHDGPGGDGRGFGGPGRKLGSADLQLLILALLEERPSHGYELIKGLEERSGGYYVPSPGVIYPALSYLEEIGYAAVTLDGTKKQYSLTDAGRGHLDGNRATVDALLRQLGQAGERMARMREAMQGGGEEEWAGFGFRSRGGGHRHRHELHAAMHEIKDAMRERFGRGRGVDEDEFRRVLAILRDAAAAVRNG